MNNIYVSNTTPFKKSDFKRQKKKGDRAAPPSSPPSGGDRQDFANRKRTTGVWDLNPLTVTVECLPRPGVRKWGGGVQGVSYQRHPRAWSHKGGRLRRNGRREGGGGRTEHGGLGGRGGPGDGSRDGWGGRQTPLRAPRDERGGQLRGVKWQRFSSVIIKWE